ncbi:MAG: hypothetical protein ACOYZ7_03885 [Chloroflexota bacterium]
MSNIYGHGFGSSQLSRLETLGFRIRPQVSRYMGSQICRFIDFNGGPCLEVIEVEDHQEYLDFVPQGMIPYCPGISLTLPEGSGKTIRDFEQEFRRLRPYLLHVNYDGSLAPRGPGWNYLNFGVPVVTDTFIWLTELEAPRPVREYDTAHPNTVKGVVGLVFDLEVESLNRFSHLVGEGIVTEIPRVGELHVWSKSAVDDLPNLHDKVFPLVAVVLKAESLDFFAASVGGAKEASFASRPAIHVETNRLSWDLLITT